MVATHEGVPKHVVFFSGGFGSWQAAKRLRAELGPDEPIHLLFTDPLIEDEDLYRFIVEAAEDVDGGLLWIAEGRDPWEVFADVKFLGNTRADPCSRVLKRELAHKWVNEHCDPERTMLYSGIGWDEAHRMIGISKAWAPYTVRAPMCETPIVPLGQAARARAFKAAGIDMPRLYRLGFSHNNCGGFCVKAGHGSFARLLERLPERYAEHEAKEEAIRAQLGDVSIMKRTVDGVAQRLTMKQFRVEIETNGTEQFNMFDEKGCGCFL